MKQDHFKDTPKVLGEAIGFDPSTLNDITPYKPKPRRTEADCVDILLDAGFTYTQIKALNKVGAIRP